MASRQELVQEINETAHRIAFLLRLASDPDKKLKNSPWTIRTAAAHLVISQKMTKQVLQGKENPYKNAKPETVAKTNTLLLSEFTERSLDKLATMLIMDTESLLKAMNNYELGHTITTHFGSMNIPTALSYNLCHLLIHGSQIASALKRPLPVSAANALLTIPFLKQSLYPTYDREAAGNFHGTFVIHIQGTNAFAIICRGTNINITDQIPQKVDCNIAADPKSFFLVSAGVINKWSLLLNRKLKIWGSKPWLALKLTQLFKSP